MVNGAPTYTPGETHTLAITGGPTNATFRGFLIQAVTVADGSVVGTFTDLPAVIPNSDGLVQAQINENCMPVGGTATQLQPDNMADRRDLPYVMLNWTAPAAGTGDIQFKYSSVQLLTTWWADSRSATVQEDAEETGGTTDGAAGIAGFVGLVMSMMFLTVLLI